MNTKQRSAMILVLLLSLAISSCVPGQIFGATVTPTPTLTFTPTVTPTLAPSATPMLTFTPTLALTPTPSCSAQSGDWSGDFSEFTVDNCTITSASFTIRGNGMIDTITLNNKSIPIVNNEFQYSFTTQNTGLLANAQTNMEFSGAFLSPTEFKGILQLPEGPVTIKASMTAAVTPAPLPASTQIATSPSAVGTFPATVMINGTDVLSVLPQNGFTYAGGEELGGCTASCAEYDDTKLGLSAFVYADASFTIFTVDLKSGADMSAQVKTLYAVIEKIYGHDMDLWIGKANAAVLGGTAQDGHVGNFDIHMELDNDGALILIEISPAS